MSPPQNKNVRVANLFVPEIRELIQERNYQEVKRLLKSISTIDLADSWRNFSASEQTLIFRLLSDRSATTLFQELEPSDQTNLIHTLTDLEGRPAMEGLTAEESAKLFLKIPEKTLKSLTRQISLETPESLTTDVMRYSENTVGSWMHSQRVVLTPNLTSSQALERIRSATRLRRGGGPDGYYVTDKSHRVVGYVFLREIIAAPARSKLDDYMNPVRLVLLHPHQDQEEAIQLFARYKLSMAPVVNENEHLLGYIQAEDILPLAQKESTEDIQKMGATEALEVPYFQVSYATMVKKRIPWLFVLFMGQLLTATAMSFFQDSLDKALILALFIPLIISSGGNSGSQAATLIVRALALKEITFRDWWKVVYREFGMGLTLGIFLGSLGFMRVYLEGAITHGYGAHAFLVGITVAIALVLIVLWGTMSGSLLPIFLHKMGFDPAVVSAPFVATLVDVTGLVIYFGTAALILKGTLL